MFTHDMNEAAQILFSVAPLLGMCVFGAVFAATHRRRAPVPARLVFAGVGLQALALVISLVIAWFPDRFLQNSWPVDVIVSGFTIISFMTSGMSAAGTLLLIMAAFTGRQHQE
jgi:hypothetical protein